MAESDQVGHMFLASLIASIGALSFGFGLGYSSSALLDLTKETNPAVRLTDSQGSWFAALLLIGAMTGGPIGGWMIEVLGRKGGIMCCCIPFEIGWLVITYAKNHWMLYIGRFVSGMGVGMISLMVPVYIAEISSPKWRGTLGSFNQLAISTGIVLSYSFGALVKWRWLAFIGAVLPALLVVLMFSMPETPIWSLTHHRRNDAKKALVWLKGPTINIENECNAIECIIDDDQGMTCSEFCKPSLLKPLILTLLAMFFQQSCGINAVTLNCGSIFEDAGFKDAKAVSIIVSVVQLCGTIIACFVLDKAGRKLLLWTAGLVMAVSLIALGIYFEIYIPSDGKPTHGLIPQIHRTVPVAKISWVAILSLMIFTFSFGLSWGPIPWVLMSELFPLKARGIASSLSTIVNWSMAFIIAKTYVNLVKGITSPGTYWLYGAITFAGFLFFLVFLPETKRKSLEEIQLLFDKNARVYNKTEIVK